MEDTAIFRSAKRKRAFRQLGPQDEESPDLPREERSPTAANPDEQAEPGVSTVLKPRRHQKSRMGGIQFSNTRPEAAAETPHSTVLVSADASAERPQTITDRFIGHSGQVVDVDRHMVAYIDSEMAKRRIAQPSNALQRDVEDDVRPVNGLTKVSDPSNRQPASLGLLNEVRLNPTEARPRSNEPAPPKPRKPRLDRFGRPMPPRKPRKGPTDEDVARDKMVEDIMKESGLGVYDKADDGKDGSTAIGGDGDVDSRLVSQFRQEYMDQMHSRQAQQKKAIPGADSAQKGPKLGGSRQQRAAMRGKELKDEKEKEKGKGG